MAWSSGTELMSNLIESVDDLVPNYDTRVELFRHMIIAFEDFDADGLEELLDESPAFKEAFELVHGPQEYNTDDEDFEDGWPSEEYSDD